MLPNGVFAELDAVLFLDLELNIFGFLFNQFMNVFKKYLSKFTRYIDQNKHSIHLKIFVKLNKNIKNLQNLTTFAE